MGTGSEPTHAYPVKTASSEVPVPIFSQPLRVACRPAEWPEMGAYRVCEYPNLVQATAAFPIHASPCAVSPTREISLPGGVY